MSVRRVAGVEVEVDLVGGRERGAVDGLEACERVLRMSLPRLDGGERGVLPAVIETMVAEAGSPLRVLLHGVVPFGRQEIRQRFSRRIGA